MRISTAGNVGIGTTNPSQKLHVIGNATISNSLTALSLSASQITVTPGTSAVPAISPVNDTNTGLFFPAADTIAFSEGGTEAMRIDSSGNVGIGNTSPGSFYSGGRQLVVGSGTGEQGITIYGGNASVSRLLFADGTSGQQAYEGQIQYDHSGNSLRFVTNGGEYLRIDSSGRVGIGTQNLASYNNAGDDLVVGNHTGAHGLTICSENNTSGYIFFADGTGAPASYAGQISYNHTGNAMLFGTLDGTERLRIDSSGQVGIGVNSPISSLHVKKETPKSKLTLEDGSTNRVGEIAGGSDGSGGLLTFSVGNNGGSITEMMRVDSSGNVLIGYTSSNGSYKLQVNSQIYATSSTVATSDEKYKKNIAQLLNAIVLVKKLNPVQFDWKEHPVHNFDTTNPTVGFIAQEVQQALEGEPYLQSLIKASECVIEPEEKDKDGNVTKEAVKEKFLGIAEGNMIALLTAALKEAITKIETLESKVAALEAT